MSVGETIGWGTAAVAVIIAVTLATASVLTVIDHFKQERKLRNLESELRTALKTLSRSEKHPFEFLRSVASHGDSYLVGPAIVEGEEAKPIDLVELRRQIGSLAAWQLRNVDWYPTAMAYVAAFDAGLRDAAHE